jgi:hypothetical protein
MLATAEVGVTTTEVLAVPLADDPAG